MLRLLTENDPRESLLNLLTSALEDLKTTADRLKEVMLRILGCQTAFIVFCH